MTPLETLTSAGYTVRHNPPNAHTLLSREKGFVDLFYGSHAKAVDYFYELVFGVRPQIASEEKPLSNEDRPVDPKHARKRCKQRFRFKMSRRQYILICDQIASGEAVRLRDSERKARSIWAVTCAGHTLPVVYDEEKKAVITVLPKRELCR
jgi:hypothetical protein